MGRELPGKCNHQFYTFSPHSIYFVTYVKYFHLSSPLKKQAKSVSIPVTPLVAQLEPTCQWQQKMTFLYFQLSRA